MKAMVPNPQDRAEAARAISEPLGGTLHQFLYRFGDLDLVVIYEVAGDKTMATASFVVSVTGAFSKLEATKLLTGTRTRALTFRLR